MVATSFPVQVLFGVYLGLLTGIIPGAVTWALALLFRYVTGLTVPSFAVVVLGVAIAGVNGGFMAFIDPSVVDSANSVTLVTALLVVMMVAFYTHSLGDKLGAAMPKRVSLRELGERTLNADALEIVGGRRQVRVKIVGGVADMEGYPPLPAPLRETIAGEEHTFPADRPLETIERELAEKLRVDHDLEDVSVALDEDARASVAAAPPASGVSKRVPTGRRAVSVSALLPTGVARGDEVTVLAGETAIGGTVLSVPTRTEKRADDAEPAATDGGEPAAPEPAGTACPGGEVRLTVAVPRTDAETLLGVERGAALVTSRGTRREFELVSLLRRAGGRVRRLSVVEGGALDGATIGAANVRETYGVAILAVRGGEWRFAPDGDTELRAGDELFAVGTADALDGFEGVAK
jgi:hypothetical protein